MNTSGLRALVAGVRAYFGAQGVSAAVDLGWTKRSRTTNQGPGGANRVVFIPGVFDPSTGSTRSARAGAIDRDAPQNHVGGDPQVRALAWWHEAVTCSVWAVDPNRPQDEEAQITETENLLELTIRGIHNAVDPETGTPVGFANIEAWGDASWTMPPGEASFGRELVFGLLLTVPLFDAPIAVAYPQAAVGRNPLT